MRPRVLPTLKVQRHAVPNHAVPNNKTLIIFDWDDTLCPTTWIRNLLKYHISDQYDWATGAEGVDFDFMHQIPAWFAQPLPDLPDVRDSIEGLQRAVIDVIKAAQSLGVVCIVTNAVEGWVDQTMKKWLPQLTPYILGHGARPPIKVLYGQQEYTRPPPGSPAASLGWPSGDAHRELTLWKKAAMIAVLEKSDELYRVAPSASTGESTLPDVSWKADHDAKTFVNVLSIGDSEAEIRAGPLAVLATVSQRPGSKRRPLSAPPEPERLPRRKPWVKTLKLWEGPRVEDIVEQLAILTSTLPQIVSVQDHMTLRSQDLKELQSDRLRRELLPTQTV